MLPTLNSLCLAPNTPHPDLPECQITSLPVKADVFIWDP